MDKTSKKVNPWAGLASYEDPEFAHSSLTFYGRDDESYDMAKLISNNIIVTLYGRSGVGKTSLLNAGVFPELRARHYMPISLRLGNQERISTLPSLQSIIVEKIEKLIYCVKEIDVIDKQCDDQSSDYLWNYFARHRFFDKDGKSLTLVLVFDQFEELLNSSRSEAETLLRQLDYINDRDHTLDNCEINGDIYQYETNYRFVLSIREDDLYKLEDSIDNCFLPALKRCRYRLHGLSDKGAKEVILLPCKETNIFDKGQENLIADKIIQICEGSNRTINTLMLSLLCYVLFKDSEEQNKVIRVSDLDNYVNIIQVYYLSLIDQIPRKQRKFLEENLVDEQGRRKSIYLSDLKKNAPDTEFLTQSSNARLLNINGDRVELVHDQLAAIIHSFRSQRIEAQITRYVTVSLSLYYIIVTYAIWYTLLTILHATWAYMSSISPIDYILEISKEFSVDKISFETMHYVIGSQIWSNVILIYLIGFALPKKICEYFYSAISIKKLLGVIGGVIISAIMGSSWLVGQVIHYNSVATPIIGWFALFIILIVSNLNNRKDGETK